MAKKIFEPIEINGMKLKNRLGLAPLLNMPREPDGSINDFTIRWFEERAKGGTALIMTGAFLPTMVSTPTAHERLAKLAEAVHSHDAKIGVQLVAAGPLSGQGPSAAPYPDETHPKHGLFDLMTGRIIPVAEVTVEQIEQLKRDFATGAAALKAAGIDCVLLHCAHGGATLYCSFISPFHNRRTDDYGGSWENRLRLPVETIQKMREAVGKEYPIVVRISADELLGKSGIALEDTTEIIVPALEEAGVDCFDVSQGSITHAPEGIAIPLYVLSTTPQP